MERGSIKTRNIKISKIENTILLILFLVVIGTAVFMFIKTGLKAEKPNEDGAQLYTVWVSSLLDGLKMYLKE